jgi:hypothetical protein
MLFNIFSVFIILQFSCTCLKAQMITGIWKGKINNKKAELKIVQKGDSLVGTSYYFESPRSYRRYAIRGYFDAKTNEAVWWDDWLIEEKKGSGLFASQEKSPYRFSADFNCPGSNKMLLIGNAFLPSKPEISKIHIVLEKKEPGLFQDEWDFVLDNFTAGANDPRIIDSISALAARSHLPEVNSVIMQAAHTENKLPVNHRYKPVASPSVVNREKKESAPQPGPAEMLIKRNQLIAVEIPLTGDSIELRFYDNAEIDGDSIALFLNNKMICQHIRLKATAFVITLPVNELELVNDLVMVAENLGTIPPNTSYMLAIVDNKRYEAIISSTEETSAVIRLIKKSRLDVNK